MPGIEWWFTSLVVLVGGVWAAYRYLSDRKILTRRENRDLLTNELDRVSQRLNDVVPTVDDTMNKYLEVSRKLMGAVDELSRVRADHSKERRQLLAMIGGYSLQLTDLRRFFESTTGLSLPPLEDPLDILTEAEEEASQSGYVHLPLPIKPPSGEAS